MGVWRQTCGTNITGATRCTVPRRRPGELHHPASDGRTGGSLLSSPSSSFLWTIEGPATPLRLPRPPVHADGRCVKSLVRRIFRIWHVFAHILCRSATTSCGSGWGARPNRNPRAKRHPIHGTTIRSVSFPAATLPLQSAVPTDSRQPARSEPSGLRAHPHDRRQCADSCQAGNERSRTARTGFESFARCAIHEPPPTYLEAWPFAGRIDRWQEIEFRVSHFLIWTGGMDTGTGELDDPSRSGFHMRGFHGITPETESTSFYFWTISSNRNPSRPDMAREDPPRHGPDVQRRPRSD